MIFKNNGNYVHFEKQSRRKIKGSWDQTLEDNTLTDKDLNQGKPKAYK